MYKDEDECDLGDNSLYNLTIGGFQQHIAEPVHVHV